MPCSTSELNHTEEKCLKFLTLHLPFCLFLIKILQLNCHPEYFKSTSLDETIRRASKWFILTQRMQNQEFVNLKRVTYAQLIHLALNADRKPGSQPSSLFDR